MGRKSKNEGCRYIGASLVAQMVENLPAVWETQVPSPLAKEMATHSSILDWRIPVDKGRLQFLSCKELDMTEAT